MIKKIAIVVGGLLVVSILVLLGLAQTQPNEFAISRSILIHAEPERAFTQLNDFHNWSAWSPWEKLDLNMKRSYSGAAHGVGAVYEWEGNKEAGKGRMEIVESVPSNKVVIDLQFLEPFEAKNLTVFTITKKDGGSELQWVMSGKNHLMSKVMCLFMDMDSMIGPDFEKGLAQLKAIAESGATMPVGAAK